MNTLNKIGQAALTRLLYSKKFSAHKVEFPKKEFDLKKVRGRDYTKDHHGSVQTVSGRHYYVWGIELGFHRLEVNESQTFDKALLEFLLKINKKGDPVYPSHIIVCSWVGGDMFSSRELTYIVHRITDKQGKLIEEMCSETRWKIAACDLIGRMKWV